MIRKLIRYSLIRKMFFVCILPVVLIYSESVPIETIVRKPEIFDVSLSLDGKYVAAIFIDSNDQQSLITYNIPHKKRNILKPYDDLIIYESEWVSNTRIAYNVGERITFGIEPDVWVFCHHLSIADRDLTKRKLLLGTYCNVIADGMLSDPDHALVYKHYQSKYSILGLLNINTGRIRNKEKIRKTIVWGNTDFNGNLNFLSVYSKGTQGAQDVLYRESPDEKWRELEIGESDYRVYCRTPFDSTKFYVTSYNGLKTRSLYVFNKNTMQLEDKVFSDSTYDFNGSLYFFYNPFHPQDSTRLRGVRYTTDYPETYWFDEKLHHVQQRIDVTLDNTINLIIDADTSLSLFLIKSFSDILPAEYHLYNSATDKTTLIFKSSPWIKPDLMAKTEAITFVTRDSLTLHGYLTRPNNRSAPYPTVVLLHGGPQARDYWGFDSEVQVLANKGYAVLQVNYRGSAGYGYTVSEVNEFTIRKMCLDVIDATKYVIQKGISDPDRIAVMGTHFGGYLSISCVANVPDLYRCAISNAGVFNWKMYVTLKWGKYSNYAFDFCRSDLSGDDENNYLKDKSLMEKAEYIKVPVFLGGGSDYTVNNFMIAKSLKLTRILSRNGIEAVTLFKQGEGHGFIFQKNRKTFYKTVLKFLKKNMGKK